MARQVEARGVDRPLVGVERLGVDAAVEQVGRVDQVGVGQEEFQGDEPLRVGPLVAGEGLPDLAERGLDPLEVVVFRLETLGVGRPDRPRQGIRCGQRCALPGPCRPVLAHLVEADDRTGVAVGRAGADGFLNGS